MNLFQKNPFVNNKNTTIQGYNPELNEKNKIEKIKINMNKIKQVKPIEEKKIEKKQMTVQEKINMLNNINR